MDVKQKEAIRDQFTHFKEDAWLFGFQQRHNVDVRHAGERCVVVSCGDATEAGSTLPEALWALAAKLGEAKGQ